MVGWILLYVLWQAPSFGWLLVVLAVAIYQLKRIFPYTKLHSLEVPSAESNKGNASSIKILISNVLMTNRNSETLKSLITQYEPDIFATLESDAWWKAELDTLPAYPHKLARTLDNLYGMHIYSKYPFSEEQIIDMVEENVPSMHAFVTLPNGDRLKLHILHPKPPAPEENYKSIERDVELLMLAQQLKGSTDKLIVTGDLNDVAWSDTTQLFRQISGLLDIRVGRGFLNTFHADHWFLRWPLDHVFTSSHFKVKNVQRLPNIGSDHFPVFTELEISDTPAVNTSPDLDDADQDLVEETLDSKIAENALQPTS